MEYPKLHLVREKLLSYAMIAFLIGRGNEGNGDTSRAREKVYY